MNHEPKYTVVSLIWRSYIKSALIPILLIEVALLAAYFATNTFIRDQNVRHLEAQVREELRGMATREADLISTRLAAVSTQTQLLADATQRALTVESLIPEDEPSRYQFSPEGAWVTTQDNGGAAGFYSNVTEVAEAQKQKAWKLSTTDYLMRSLVESSPLVAQAYFNSYDSFNRIYPYFDTASQYPADLRIPDYNFYYDADATHNPERKPVWTDVYIDPAGQGWMASCVAPVYTGDFLEGVVGLDILVKDIINDLLKLQIPWNAYAVLIGRDGVLMALPPQGEVDWGLDELTDHSYESAIQQDTFKPEAFNVLARSDTQELAARIKDSSPGLISMELQQRSKLVAFNPIPDTGWGLALIVDEDEIFSEANALQQRFERVGLWMLAGLVFFYVIFFLWLYRKALGLSRHIAAPLQTLANMIEAIGGGDYRQIGRYFEVKEIQQTSDGLVAMGEKLENSNRRLKTLTETLERLNADLERRVSERTSALERANKQLEKDKAEQSRLYEKLRSTQAQLVQTEKLASLGQLAAGVAHEINNPLSFINSNVVCLKDYAESLVEMIDKFEQAVTDVDLKAELRRQKEHYQFDFINEELPDLINDSIEGVRRVRKIVENLREFSHSGNTEWQSANLNDCIASTLTIAFNEIKYKAEIKQDLAELPNIYCIPSQLNQIILNLLVNAAQAIEERGEIALRTYAENDGVVLEVSDTGKGIPAAVKSKIFDPFFTTKDIGEGTGLGLSISYGIVQAHNGTIEVESTEGEGTRFKIWLPLKQDDSDQ